MRDRGRVTVWVSVRVKVGEGRDGFKFRVMVRVWVRTGIMRTRW